MILRADGRLPAAAWALGLVLAALVAAHAAAAEPPAAGKPAGAGRQALAASPSGSGASTADEAIAVLYPNLGEPFGTVFRQIVAGIEAGAPAHVTSIALPGTYAPERLAGELRDKGIRVIIALGRHGLEAAEGVADGRPVVGGAVLASPGDRSPADTVVSLTPDPELLLERLRQIAPKVRRVFVVYSAQNAWLVGIAQKTAERVGLELVAMPAEDLRGALHSFQEITHNAHPGTDAIWLPQDALVLDQDVVLPFVLQQAWDRSLVLFSSTLAHVQRGALFALYPDNQQMGRRLAGSAVELARARTRKYRVEPLRDLQAAVNLRTAGHLGLDVDASLNDYALVFPVR